MVTFVPKETRLCFNPISFLSLILHEDLADVLDENLNNADAWLLGLNRGLQEPIQEEKEQPFSNTRSNLFSRSRIRVSIENHRVLMGHIRDIGIESNMG